MASAPARMFNTSRFPINGNASDIKAAVTEVLKNAPSPLPSGLWQGPGFP